MIIYTNRPYTTGKFYQYINVGLIPLDESFKPPGEWEDSYLSITESDRL